MLWTLTEKNFEHIGRVAAESAELEITLDWMIPSILGIREEMYQTMFANKTIGPKIDLLKQAGLSKLKGKQRIEAFTSIVIVLTRFIKERNLAVHGKWSPGGAGVTLGALAMIGNQKPMAASSHKKKGQLLSVKRLEHLAEDMHILNRSLYLFWKCVWVDPYIKSMNTKEKKRALANAIKHEPKELG
ncbi:MAG: hypothetical protein WA825_05200 [Steroidobacteraceae bacterium]